MTELNEDTKEEMMVGVVNVTLVVLSFEPFQYMLTCSKVL